MIVLLFCLAISCACFCRAFYLMGVVRGKDIGWTDAICDRLNRDFARDRARRNRLGQFKGNGAQS